MSKTCRYHVPQKGDHVALDADPAAVGLHDVCEQGDGLNVLRRRITERDGFCVVVVPIGETTTYRLRWDHVRPLN